MSRSSAVSLRVAAWPLMVVLISATSLSAQTTLRWRFQRGQVLVQVIEQEMIMAAKNDNLDIETKMTQTIDARWHIRDVNEQGVATIEQDFQRIRMKMDGAGDGFEFDSNDPKELEGVGALVGPALKALAGTKFVLTMSPDGKIDNVVVSDEAVAALQSIPGGNQLGGMFSKEGLIKMIKQGSFPFPEVALKKGESWTVKTDNELAQIGKMVVTANLTYMGPEVVDGRDLERVDLDLTTTLPAGGNALVKLKKQSAKGKIYFDNQVGRVAVSKLVQEMTMGVTFGGQSIDQKINQKITVRVSEAAN